MMKPTESDRQSIERRKFLKYGVAGMAIASTSHVTLARDGRQKRGQTGSVATLAS